MATWNSRGLRGSTLEDAINITNDKYRNAGLALIQKIPTPIKPVKIDKEQRHITLAYFEQRSTVDYIGAVQGIPICFDAKECITTTFPIQNIHEHQILFMEDFELQGGISFLIIHFSSENIYYYLKFEELSQYWNRSKTGHQKNFKLAELNPTYYIKTNGYHIHYLELIQKDLNERDEKDS